MNRERSVLPQMAQIETRQVPIEWLHGLALREGNSRKPVYRIHKWWARRLGSVFRTLLILALTDSGQQAGRVKDDFYSRNDFHSLVVFDPFMGGGTSIVEASKFGAKTVGIDIDPVAWFTTKMEISPCPREKILEVMRQLEVTVGKEISEYYVTRTAADEVAPVLYYFWVDVIACPQCGVQFELHPHYQLHRNKRDFLQTVFCRACHTVHVIALDEPSVTCRACGTVTEVMSATVRRGMFICPRCRFRDKVLSVVEPDRPPAKRLFAIEYGVQDEDGQLTRAYKAADTYDQNLFNRAAERLRQLWDRLPFPRDAIPVEGRSDPRPVSHGYKYYYQLFNDRQLLCLSLIYREIGRIADREVRDYLLIGFSDSLSSNNMLCSYAFAYRKLTPLFGLHAFNVVNRPVENNVWGSLRGYGRGTFRNCVRKVLRGKDFAERPYELRYTEGKPEQVFTGEKITASVTDDVEKWYRGEARSLLLNRSSTRIEELKSKSVDLILTDPPYYNNLSYSELSDFFYVWLRDYLKPNPMAVHDASAPYRTALYVDRNSDDKRGRFITDLSAVFSECNRLLRPGGLMVFTFHHRYIEAWDALARALYASDFTVTNLFPVRSEGRSGFHSTEGTIKWDAVLVCRQEDAHIQSQPKNPPSIKTGVKAELVRWENRIKRANLAFGWADRLSLGYALALQQTLVRARDPEEITVLLGEATESLMPESTPSS